jgi:hypothetical protein
MSFSPDGGEPGPLSLSHDEDANISNPFAQPVEVKVTSAHQGIYKVWLAHKEGCGVGPETGHTKYRTPMNVALP